MVGRLHHAYFGSVASTQAVVSLVAAGTTVGRSDCCRKVPGKRCRDRDREKVQRHSRAVPERTLRDSSVGRGGGGNVSWGTCLLRSRCTAKRLDVFT